MLRKAHPGMRDPFRSQYEKGTELIVMGMELAIAKGPDAENLRLLQDGTALVNRWTDWLNAHRKEIRLPRDR